MLHLPPPVRAAILCCWVLGGCGEGGGGEGEETGPPPATTEGTGVGTQTTSTGSEGEQTGPSPATDDGTSTSGSGPSEGSSGEPDTGSTSTGPGEPGDWLLTVDRGSNPPRLVKVGLRGGPVEVCVLAASVDYTSLVFARDGTLYGHNAAQGRIDVIDPCTCSFQIVGPTSLGPLALGLAGVGDEGLLGLDAGLDALVRVDAATGLGAVVGPLGYIFEGSAIAWSDALGQPYAVEGANDYLYSVDPSTGAATPLVPLVPGVTEPGLAAHPNGDDLYVCDGDVLYGLDPGTGALSMIGALGLGGACRTLAAPQTAVACVDDL